jgi:2-polyprenyl-6-methoxyphenol hydroxylase-like FAD-dependent oxidoreductase
MIRINSQIHRGIGIVGGSLSGVCAAIALVRKGWDVTVFEQVVNAIGGSGLGVDPDLLEQVVGLNPLRSYPGHAALPLIRTYRYSASWYLLLEWLKKCAKDYANIDYRTGIRIDKIGETPTAAFARSSSGENFYFSGILGADGYRSVARRYVNPDQPEAKYAGYLLWRGVAEENWFRDKMKWPDEMGYQEFPNPQGFRLVAYAIPGSQGEVSPGKRRISFAWYDCSRQRFLEHLGCLKGDEVLRTVQYSDIPQSLLTELMGYAQDHWPYPWNEFIVESIKRKAFFGTPIAEYIPTRLIRSRVALIGDAAHVASPMSGGGFRHGLLDAVSLAQRSASKQVGEMLQLYEEDRLASAQRLVAAGQKSARAFGLF